jgi:hypothetical protein
MIQRLLLVLLGLFLVWLTFPDPANPLAEWDRTDDPPAGNADEWKRLHKRLEEEAATARDLGRLEDPIRRAALLVSEDCREKGKTDLEQALVDHLARLSATRRFIRLYAARAAGIDPGDVGDTSAVTRIPAYRDLLKDLDDLRQREQKITRLAQAYPDGEAELTTELVAYAQQARTEPERVFLRTITAHKQRVDVERKYLLVAGPGGELYAKIGDALGMPAAASALRATVEELLEALRDYEKRYRDAAFPKWVSGPRPAQWAEGQATRWEPYRDLLRLAEEAGRLSLADRLVRLEQLYGRKPARVAFLDLVRRESLRVCENALPEKLEPDDRVYVKYLGQPRKVERRAVEVVLKSEPDRPPRPLLPFEECRLLMKDIVKVSVNDSGVIYDRELVPTPRTQAAFEYVQGRKELKWTKASLEKLRQRCRKTTDLANAWQGADLHPCWKNLNDLLEGVRQCPGLFGQEDEDSP